MLNNIIRLNGLQLSGCRALHLSKMSLVQEALPNIIPKNENLYLREKKKSLKESDYFDVASMFTVEDLFYAKVHLGHKNGCLWNDNLRFCYGSRFDYTIIDLDQTVVYLQKALNIAAQFAFRDAIILFMCRTPRFQELVEYTAKECGEFAHCYPYHFHMLTNSSAFFDSPVRLPDLIILFSLLDNSFRKHTAIRNAARMLIPTIGIVDTNVSSKLVTYPVPGNDDSPEAMDLYCNLFKNAILKAKQKRKDILKKEYISETG